MGAQISTVYGRNPAVQIAEYARVSGVTKIAAAGLTSGSSNYAASGLSEEELERIVADNTKGKLLGIFGEETVNVLGVRAPPGAIAFLMPS